MRRALASTLTTRVPVSVAAHARPLMCLVCEQSHRSSHVNTPDGTEAVGDRTRSSEIERNRASPDRSQLALERSSEAGKRPAGKRPAGKRPAPRPHPNGHGARATPAGACANRPASRRRWRRWRGPLRSARRSADEFTGRYTFTEESEGEGLSDRRAAQRKSCAISSGRCLASAITSCIV